LKQNYPNPFNPETKIKFDIPSSASSGLNAVSLKVYDIQGKQVEVLVNQNMQPGTYEIGFDGGKYSSGIYFYTLETGMFRETKKMILTK
jgi:Secretion system C-terminal sorting domain